MTQDSFNNYISNLYYYKEKMAYRLSNSSQIGCINCEDIVKFNIASSLIDVVANWTMVEEGKENPNDLTIEEMQKITYALNRLFGTAYNINYIID